MSRAHVYLAPGMFGFARLAGLDYMGHVVAALEERLRARHTSVEAHVVDLSPSASVRRRAAELVGVIAETVHADDGPIHLLGHSLGGLDVRLVASPTADLDGIEAVRRPWLDRLRSVTTLDTPHYGSPGGAFFASSQGQRVIYALSAITVASLRLGSPPLAITSAVVAALGRTRERAGLELRLIERLIDALQRALDEHSRDEVQAWLREVRDDQGAVAQLMPEAMDLFQAGVEDKPGLRYQCVACFAPPSRGFRGFRDLRDPWAPLSSVVFQLLYRVAAVQHPRYPCAPPDGGDAKLRAVLGTVPPPEANDGMVPLRSQLWGELVWAGEGDHLDVIGHFDDPPAHRDWLHSGSRFDRRRFDEMLDRIVEGMLAGEGPAA